MRNVLNYLLSMLIGIAVGIACYGSYQSHNYHPTPEPEIQYIYVDKEKIVEVPIEVEVPVYVNEEFYRTLTEDDAYYLKDMAMREAESEGVQGMLWVMYCMECRRKAFGGSYADVWRSDAFSTSWNRRGIEPNEDCAEALALFEQGWIPKPLYFRTEHYHGFGTELCQYGNHYFSM